MVGTNVSDFPDTVNRMEKLGCELGNHTYSHKDLTSLSSDEISNQVEDMNYGLNEFLGHGSSLVRPPYGSVNEAVQSNVKSLTETISKLEGQISALEQQIAAAQAAGEDVTALQAQLAALQQSKSEAEPVWPRPRPSIPQLEAGISKAKATQSQLQSQLDQLYTTSNGQTVPVSTSVFLSANRQIQQAWQEDLRRGSRAGRRQGAAEGRLRSAAGRRERI